MDALHSILTNDLFLSTVLGFVAVHLQGGRMAHLPRWARYGISLGACVVISFAATVVANTETGGLNVDQILKNAGQAFIVAQTWYNLYFKPKSDGADK